MPTIKIHNSDTGEIFERELTIEEISQLEIDQAAAAAEAVAKADAAAGKAALLEKLGITEEEAKLLLS